jgi:hypothetical protein
MTPSGDTEYTARVEQLIGLLAQSHALGREIDLPMCVAGLEPGRNENRKVRDFVTRTLKVPGREFDQAMRLETVRHELGRLPRTAREFVEAYAAKRGITAQYNGVLRLNEVPYVMNADGTREYIPPTLWETDDFRSLIRTNFRRPIGFAELQQSLRVYAAELRLDFNSGVINDAAEIWYADVCRNRLWQIMDEIDYRPRLRDVGQEQLLNMVTRCFKCNEGAPFAVAVFNKFIWQVKRKIEGLPIYNHLMPVILGCQGAGKSTLVTKLLGPIEELWANTDFRQITDDRNISIWRNFALFMDEMGWAKRSDMDAVKNVLTAKFLTRRVMRTNVTQEVAQNVTFIGTANAADVGELIRDTTGTRRFVSLEMVDDPDWSMINSINWLEVWQSVDHEADDPMAEFRDLLAARQEAERAKTPIEDWLHNIPLELTRQMEKPERRFRSIDLHTYFREFEDARHPGQLKTSLQSFIREMRRHADRGGLFRCVQEGSYILWERRQ